MVGGWSRVIQDRYRVDRELGHRGQFTTWLVTDLRSVSPCVLKCLREAEAPPEEARLFEARARVLTGLDHPGIPRLVEYFVEGEGGAREHVLITRYHPGESLDRLVAKGRLFSEAQAVALLRRLAAVLAYLHGFDPPLVHRSIKAANIIIGPDGRPCLTDLNFAVAGEVGKAWEEAPPEAGDLTLSAPEAAVGDAVPASDVYALGLAVIYAMSGKDPVAIAQEGARQRIRETTRASEAFAAILARMVEPAPERRYADGRALEADLARLATGRAPAAVPTAAPLKVATPSPPPAPLPPAAGGGRGEEARRGNPRRTAVLAALLVAAAAAMLWLNVARRAGEPAESLLAPPASAPPAAPAGAAAPVEAPAPLPAAPEAGVAPAEAGPASGMPAAPVGGAADTASPPAAAPEPVAEPTDTPNAPRSDVAPTPADADPVVAEGRLLFDGQPVTRLTALAPTFWFRNEAKGTPEKPRVEYRDGAFRVRGLPAGRMGMSMRVNLEPGNPNLYPGDLDAWATFVVGEGPPPVLEVNLRKIVRLLQPADNNAVIHGWDEACGAGSVHPGRVLFAWEPLDPAATYEVAIERLACGRNYAVAGRAFSAKTSEAWVKSDLPPSAEAECYSFRLSASKDGRPLGMLTTHGRNGLGWDYRFTVK